jgi:hypothetical protein
VFEESLGHLEEARRLYKHVYEKVVPGLFAGLLQHLSLERRETNYEVADQLYSEAFNIEETSEEPSIFQPPQARSASSNALASCRLRSEGYLARE